MSHPKKPTHHTTEQHASFEQHDVTAFHVVYQQILVGITTVFIIATAFLLGSTFYNLVVLLGISLVLTYVLLSPVNLLEKALIKGLNLLSSLREKNSPNNSNPSPSLKPFQANRITRSLCVVVVYASFFSLLTYATINLLPILGDQLTEFISALPNYIEQASVIIIDWAKGTLGPEAVQNFLKTDANQDSAFSTTFNQALNTTVSTVISQLGNLNTVVSTTIRGFLYTISGLVLVFYFLTDGLTLRRQFLSMLPTASRRFSQRLIHNFHNVMFAFIKGQVLLGLLTGTYMFIVYSTFGVRYAFLLGAFFAVAEILPVVGTWIGITPGILVMLFSDDPMITLWVWLCSYSFQTLKDNVIAPKVVGEVMGLHPVVVILSLVICAKTAGLFGVLLALPLASFLSILIHYYVDDKESSEHTHKASESPESPETKGVITT